MTKSIKITNYSIKFENLTLYLEYDFFYQKRNMEFKYMGSHKCPYNCEIRVHRMYSRIHSTYGSLTHIINTINSPNIWLSLFLLGHPKSVIIKFFRNRYASNIFFIISRYFKTIYLKLILEHKSSPTYVFLRSWTFTPFLTSSHQPTIYWFTLHLILHDIKWRFKVLCHNLAKKNVLCHKTLYLWENYLCEKVNSNKNVRIFLKNKDKIKRIWNTG